MRSPIRVLPTMIAATALCAAASACAPAAAPDTRAQDEAAIRAADTAWSAAAQAKDIAKAVSYYTADATVMPPNEPKGTGSAEARKIWEGMLGTPGLNVTWQPTNVEVAKAGDLGYSFGTYQLSVTGPDGKPVNDRGKYVEIWKKQGDGTWKCLVDTFNSDLPAAPAAPDKKPATPVRKGRK